MDEFIEAIHHVRVRFSIADVTNESVTEAGIDSFADDRITGTSCPVNLDNDHEVGIYDLLILLASGPVSRL